MAYKDRINKIYKQLDDHNYEPSKELAEKLSKMYVTENEEQTQEEK